MPRPRSFRTDYPNTQAKLLDDEGENYQVSSILLLLVVARKNSKLERNESKN